MPIPSIKKSKPVNAASKQEQDPPKRSKAEAAILRKLTPAQKLPPAIDKTVLRITESIRHNGIKARVKIGGSIAKGTYLKGDHDIDLFVRFSTEYKNEELSRMLEKILAGCKFDIEKIHGSRDYFHTSIQGYMFEIIPVFDISSWEEAVNVTDMSPLHVEYVRGKLDQKPWLAQDIRLAKQFCKSAKIYGAESYIGGFSGHVIDLLIIHYQGFRNLLSAAASWPAKIVLDPESNLNSPLTELNPSKIQAPLVIVDPVQNDRNSAAAVSKEAFEAFKKRAKEYLAAIETIAPNTLKTSADRATKKIHMMKAPDSSGFFKVVPLNTKTFSKANPDSIVYEITVSPLAGKKDVIGAKCLKIYEYCAQQLIQNDFRMDATAWEFNEKKTTMLFAVKNEPLSAQVERQGPPVHKYKDAAEFKKKHQLTIIKNDKLYSIDDRKYLSPKKLLDDAIRSKYVKERCEKITIIELKTKTAAKKNQNNDKNRI